MSGKIILTIRAGASLDWRYKYYPEAYLIIMGEDGKTTTISPPYESKNRGDSIEEMLIEFRRHELKVDSTRERKHQTSKLIKFLENLIPKLRKIELTEFNDLEEYKKINQKR
jgi:hypothetical protein